MTAFSIKKKALLQFNSDDILTGTVTWTGRVGALVRVTVMCACVCVFRMIVAFEASVGSGFFVGWISIRCL